MEELLSSESEMTLLMRMTTVMVEEVPKDVLLNDRLWRRCVGRSAKGRLAEFVFWCFTCVIKLSLLATPPDCRREVVPKIVAYD